MRCGRRSHGSAHDDHGRAPDHPAHRQPPSRRARGRGAPITRRLSPRGSRAHRHARGLRAWRVRRLHRPRGRPERAKLSPLRGAARRRQRHDHRGPDSPRSPEPAPAGVLRHARHAVRLLHARHDRHRHRAPRAASLADGRADPGLPRRAALHVHGLRQHRPCHPGRCGRPPGHAMSSWVGASVPVKEDLRLVAGRGRFTDDIGAPGMLHAAMLRSPHAHARIVSIDTAKAATHPGVAAVIVGAEAARLSGPIRPLIPTTAVLPDFCLAVDRVRYVGEPVAAVAAVDRATAEDALELIEVEYDPLPAVLYPELGTNVVWHDTLSYGDVDGAMARADGVLRERFTIQRYASTPLETFGALATYDAGTDAYEFWTNDQRPGLTISIVAASLGVPQSRIRLSCPDIGGAFGNKRRPAYLLVCALLAKRTGRPVKWIEDRIENLTALMHACNGVMDVELAYRADGTLLALSVRDITDEGKNLLTPTQHNLIKLGNIANGYRIHAVRYEAWSVLTTKCPSGANRGIGKPFMCFAV